MKILVLVDAITLFDGESKKPDTVELVIDGVKVTVTKPKPKPKKRAPKKLKTPVTLQTTDSPTKTGTETKNG